MLFQLTSKQREAVTIVQILFDKKCLSVSAIWNLARNQKKIDIYDDNSTNAEIDKIFSKCAQLILLFRNCCCMSFS